MSKDVYGETTILRMGWQSLREGAGCLAFIGLPGVMIEELDTENMQVALRFVLADRKTRAILLMSPIIVLDVGNAAILEVGGDYTWPIEIGQSAFSSLSDAVMERVTDMVEAEIETGHGDKAFLWQLLSAMSVLQLGKPTIEETADDDE